MKGLAGPTKDISITPQVTERHYRVYAGDKHDYICSTYLPDSGMEDGLEEKKTPAKETD